jgi:ligand-binding sensor domain-containing protein
MKKFAIALIFLLLAACETRTPQATTPTKIIPDFPPGWVSYTNANENILDIAFDQNGYLWAASRGGLVRWNVDDGTYRKFTTADGLPSNEITAVLPARDGTLWVATRGGLASFDGEQWTIYPMLEQGSVIQEIYQDSHDRLWFATRWDGVLTFDGRHWTTYSMDDGLGSNWVDAVAEDKQGNIWLGTWFFYCGCEGEPNYIEGVSRFDGQGWTVHGADIGLDDEDPASSIHVTSIAVDPKGGIWFGTVGFGAVYYDGTNHTTFMTVDGLSDDTVNEIQIDKNGTVWFATPGGLARYDSQNWDVFTVDDGLVDNLVLSLVIAPDGTVLAGTASGISFFDGHNWHALQTDDRLPSNQVNGIDSTPEGVVWLATDRGAAAFDGSMWQAFTADNGLPGAGVTSAVAVAPDGSIWLGTQALSSPPDSGAIVHIETDGNISYTPLEMLRNAGIHEIMEGVYAIDIDALGDVWVGSYEAWHFNGSNWTSYTQGSNYWVVRPEKLVISPTLGVWTGDWGGICQFFDQNWICYGPQYKNQVGWDVRGLAIAPDGAVWVATELSDETFHTQTGFKRFDGQTWTVETTLNQRDVTDMDFAPNGTLWVATRAGAYRYQDGNWTHYTVEDGLAGNEILHIHVANDGSVWFATSDGLTRYENQTP